MSRILIIEDDLDIISLLGKFLVKHGYEVETAFTAEKGEELFDSFKPDLVMCDYRLDNTDAALLLKRFKEKKPEVPLVIITGYSDLKTAVRVIKMGATDYITKPFIPDEILLNINNALKNRTSADASHKLNKNKIGQQYLFSNSIHSKHLLSQIALVAPTDYSVIVYGESGVGKEGIARSIHDKSLRNDKPYIAMDCGAISKDLAGSELFGHEKGSFTGAFIQKIGHFEMANGGTLFLDEIANLPYDVQTSLLRVIQEKVVRRIGNTRETPVDVRLIVASNERITESIQKGRFREDLYHRLNEFSIEVPSLRNRREDILFFAHHFLKEIVADLNNKNIQGFESEVEDIFLNYQWYGNIRELRNVIKRAALLTTGDKVNIKSLPFEILNYTQNELHLQRPDDLPVKAEVMVEPKTASPDEEGQFSKHKLKKAAMEAEYEMIMNALTETKFNKSKAAEMLGVDRKTLYNKLKQMQIMGK